MASITQERNLKVQIDSELAWLIPYIEIASKFINIKKINKIYGLRVSKKKDKKDRFYGICHYDEYDNVSIGLYLDYMSVVSIKKNTWQIKNLKIQTILASLAHELTHMNHHDHSPDRMIMECKIIIEFMKKLKSDGYISEEKDEKRL